jgi:hypothetical protein
MCVSSRPRLSSLRRTWPMPDNKPRPYRRSMSPRSSRGQLLVNACLPCRLTDVDGRCVQGRGTSQHGAKAAEHGCIVSAVRHPAADAPSETARCTPTAASSGTPAWPPDGLRWGRVVMKTARARSVCLERDCLWPWFLWCGFGCGDLRDGSSVRVCTSRWVCDASL